MSPRRLPPAGMRKNWRRAAAALTTATVALCVSGMTTAPAQSAGEGECPTAYTGDLNQDLAQNPNLTVTTKTVVRGQTPQEFTGHPLGVLKDGIAPGLDMILVDFSSTDGGSTQIDKSGIWEGMSGSPVYYNGQLLGAVAYGLAGGINPIAGVTPATEMQKMLTAVPGGTSAAAPRKVSLPARMARRIVASGAATSTEVNSGMKQLEVPFGISGVDFGNRRAQLAKALGLRNARPMAAGSVGAGAADIPIVAGGNVAASISYGEITAAGLGTATAVCGDEVLAFGHPMNFTGASTMTMHGADAIYVQSDPTWASFKVANLGGPVGTVDQDHLAGLHGLVGPAPASSVVTSHVAVGPKDHTGTTNISVPEAVPDIALANVVTDQDVTLDGLGGGSGRFYWEIDGTRRDGSPLVVRRTDDFADQNDISYATVLDLADLLYSIQYGGYGVKIDSVTTDSNLSHEYLLYTLRKVQIRRHGEWHKLSPDRPLRLRAGSLARLRVTLASKELGTRTVRTDLPVPAGAAGKVAVLQVTGGGYTGDSGDGSGGGVDVFESSSVDIPDPTAKPTLDDLIHQLHATPRHSDVIADMTWIDQKSGVPTNHRHTHAGTDHVVDGSLSFQVLGVPARR